MEESESRMGNRESPEEWLIVNRLSLIARVGRPWSG